MKWRSALFVVACLLLLGSLAHAATPVTAEVSSPQVSPAQLPFCLANLVGPQLPTWNATSGRNATPSGLICGSCSGIVCRGATAGQFCGRSMHCDQISECSDGTYYCECLANNI
jgi:hypothetical protein